METGITPRQALTSLASLLVILGGLYALFHYFGITEVQETIEQAGVWAPLVLILAKASTIVIVPLGGAVLYPLAGALFGFWEGLALLVIGDALGGIVSFYLSRVFGRHLVERLLGDDTKFLARALKMMGSVKGFLVARICFAPFPEVVTYGAGLTRINFFPFILIHSSVGVFPTAVLAGLGSALTLSAWWILPLVLIGGALIIPVGFFLFRATLAEWERVQ